MENKETDIYIEKKRLEGMYFTLTSFGQLFSYIVYSAALMIFNFNMFPYLLDYVTDKNYFIVNFIFMSTQHICMAIIIMSFTMCVLIPATFELTGSYDIVINRYNDASKKIYFLTWFAGFFYLLELLIVLIESVTFSLMIPSIIFVFLAVVAQAIYSLDFTRLKHRVD